MADATVNVRDLTHRITLRVKGLKSWSLRLRIAALLFRLGARIAGVGIVFESGPITETTKPGDAWRSFEREGD